MANVIKSLWRAVLEVGEEQFPTIKKTVIFA